MGRTIEVQNVKVKDLGKKRTFSGIIKHISKPLIWVKNGVYECGERNYLGHRFIENPLSSPGNIIHELDGDDLPPLHDKTCRLIVAKSELLDYQTIEFEDSNFVLIYTSNKTFKYNYGDEITFSGTVSLVHNPRSKTEINYFSTISSRCNIKETSFGETTIETGKKTSVRNQERMLIQIISTLQNQSTQQIKLANILDVYTEAEKYSLSRTKAEDIIEKLVRNGDVMRPAGYDTVQIV
jgi:DNA replicative helicase MCM subunit Mcm2 (Cdc46/Mcm family)